MRGSLVYSVCPVYSVYSVQRCAAVKSSGQWFVDSDRCGQRPQATGFRHLGKRAASHQPQAARLLATRLEQEEAGNGQRLGPK
jgi:hypothetical protein